MIIPETIKTYLERITAVADDLLMKAYIVGGMPRDILFGLGITDDTDIDITEVNGNAFDLAYFVAAKYDLQEPEIYESSGTALVVMPDSRFIEFHNAYYNAPHIIDSLHAIGIEPTSINKDVYSRDFTINSLLMDLESEEIFDLTGKGKEDIANKVLRTPLDPLKTLAIDPKRILRGIRFKIQFGLKVDPEYEKVIPRFIPELKKFLLEHPNSRMVLRTTKKIMEMDAEQGMEEFKRLGLAEFLPKTSQMDKVVKEKMWGTTITPTTLIPGKDKIKIIAQQGRSGMEEHLFAMRSKHKAYMDRKKREIRERRNKKIDYIDNLQQGIVPQVRVDDKKKKDMGPSGGRFVKKRR